MKLKQLIFIVTGVAGITACNSGASSSPTTPGVSQPPIGNPFTSPVMDHLVVENNTAHAQTYCITSDEYEDNAEDCKNAIGDGYTLGFTIQPKTACVNIYGNDTANYFDRHLATVNIFNLDSGGYNFIYLTGNRNWSLATSQSMGDIYSSDRLTYALGVQFGALCQNGNATFINNAIGSNDEIHTTSNNDLYFKIEHPDICGDNNYGNYWYIYQDNHGLDDTSPILPDKNITQISPKGRDYEFYLNLPSCTSLPVDK